MPIHYEIIYDVSTNDPDCELWDPNTDNPVEVHLVQNDTVKYPGPRDDHVEEVVVYYSQDASQTYPTEPFKLRIKNTGTYTLTLSNCSGSPPCSGELISGTSPPSQTTPQTPGSNDYQWDFDAPTNVSVTLFEFGDGSGPPSKLAVKVKKQTGFSCD